MKSALPTAPAAYGLNGPSATATVDNATPAGLHLSTGKFCPNKRGQLSLYEDRMETAIEKIKEALAETQDDAAILRSHASDIDVANRIEEIALALDGYFSYERGLDPYIDELNKLAAKIRNGEEV